MQGFRDCDRHNAFRRIRPAPPLQQHRDGTELPCTRKNTCKQLTKSYGVPILQLKRPDRSRWDDRKLDHVRPHLQRAEREGRYGVVAIVACQEFQWVLSARNRQKKPGARPNFEYFKEERRVGIYYF